MKADIVTLVIFVFCLGVLISALDIGSWMGKEESAPAEALVLQQSSDNS